MTDKDITICRCEEVTESEIIEAIRAGDTTIEAVKRRTRAGMGFCQGRTCRRLVARLISIYSDIPYDEAIRSSIRVPVGPIPLGLIAETADGLEEED